MRALVVARANDRTDHRNDDHSRRRLHANRAARGLTGALFREFALTLAGAVLFPVSLRLSCRR